MGRMNTGEAFERQALLDLNAACAGSPISFSSHGSGDDAFSNDISISGKPGLRDIEAKQMKAPTGQFTLAVEDLTLVWSDSSRCVGATLDETVAILDFLNRMYPNPATLVSAVMYGRSTVPVLCDPHVLGEWVRKYYVDLKGNDLLIVGRLGTHGEYGCIDLRPVGALDGFVTATVRRRTSGTRDVTPDGTASAMAAVGAHLSSVGVDTGGIAFETLPYRNKARLYVRGELPEWGRRDGARYVKGDTSSYYISPNDGAVRVLSAGAGNPCLSFWGDFRSLDTASGMDAVMDYVGIAR